MKSGKNFALKVRSEKNNTRLLSNVVLAYEDSLIFLSIRFNALEPVVKVF